MEYLVLNKERWKWPMSEALVLTFDERGKGKATVTKWLRAKLKWVLASGSDKNQDSVCCLSSIFLGMCISQVQMIRWPNKQNTDQMADGPNGVTFLCRPSPHSSCHKSLLDAANPSRFCRENPGPINSDFLREGEARLNSRLWAVSETWSSGHIHCYGMKDESEGKWPTAERKAISSQKNMKTGK